MARGVEQLARLFHLRLTEAHAAPKPPSWDTSMALTHEAVAMWLQREAAYWAEAAQQRGLTSAQRTMRMSVSRFYAERLTVHRQSGVGPPASGP